MGTLLVRWKRLTRHLRDASFDPYMARVLLGYLLRCGDAIGTYGDFAPLPFPLDGAVGGAYPPAFLADAAQLAVREETEAIIEALCALVACPGVVTRLLGLLGAQIGAQSAQSVLPIGAIRAAAAHYFDSDPPLAERFRRSREHLPSWGKPCSNAVAELFPSYGTGATTGGHHYLQVILWFLHAQGRREVQRVAPAALTDVGFALTALCAAGHDPTQRTLEWPADATTQDRAFARQQCVLGMGPHVLWDPRLFPKEEEVGEAAEAEAVGEAEATRVALFGAVKFAIQEDTRRDAATAKWSTMYPKAPGFNAHADGKWPFFAIKKADLEPILQSMPAIVKQLAQLATRTRCLNKRFLATSAFHAFLVWWGLHVPTSEAFGSASSSRTAGRSWTRACRWRSARRGRCTCWRSCTASLSSGPRRCPTAPTRPDCARRGLGRCGRTCSAGSRASARSGGGSAATREGTGPRRHRGGTAKGAWRFGTGCRWPTTRSESATWCAVREA